MAITKITVYSATNTMGDNVTEADADGFRAWLAAELEREFPGAEITVSDDQATNTIETDAEINDYADVEMLQAFVGAAWDRCPWSWVS
jgi:disulfide oxidoreductase YuzD